MSSKSIKDLKMEKRKKIRRSIEAQKRRNEMKRVKMVNRRKNALSNLAEERQKLKDVEKELEDEKKKVKTLEKCYTKHILSSVSRGMMSARKRSKSLSTLLPSCVQLSEQVLSITDIIIGEGTFGIVKLAYFKTLKVYCAVKIGKMSYFDAVRECRIFQKVQGCCYFPYVYGVLNNCLVMEFVGEEENVKTVYSERKMNYVSQLQWTRICYHITAALLFLHKSGLLHNDIKSNNVLLKKDTAGSLVPKVIDMGKVTTKREPAVYKLTQRQKERYNKLHTYLAPELRNNFGAKCSIYSDIYSLGVMFSYVSDADNSLLQYLIARMSNPLPSSHPNTLKCTNTYTALLKNRMKSDVDVYLYI